MGTADQAFERWAYGEGWSAGLLEGHRRGFDEGYRAGFDAGAEIGAARVLLELEHAFGERLLDLLTDLPQVGKYLANRRRTARSDEPCLYGCGVCSQCIRAAAATASTARHGAADDSGNGTVQRGRS
jgi:hypothetical protein